MKKENATDSTVMWWQCEVPNNKEKIKRLQTTDEKIVSRLKVPVSKAMMKNTVEYAIWKNQV